MEKLSNHLSKTIIDITTAEELGALVGISTSGTDITHIVSSNNIAIATGDIVSLGDYVTVRGSGQVECPATLPSIGEMAILANGASLGKIIDYEFTQKYKLKSVLCEEGVQNAAKISVFNQKYIIFTQKNYVKQPNSEYTTKSDVAILPIVSAVTPQTQAVPEVTPPRQAVSDYSFLVGRMITRDIFAGSKRLFCANNIITDQIVSDAKLSNKLVELTLYSQKNI